MTSCCLPPWIVPHPRGGSACRRCGRAVEPFGRCADLDSTHGLAVILAHLNCPATAASLAGSVLACVDPDALSAQARPLVDELAERLRAWGVCVGRKGLSEGAPFRWLAVNPARVPPWRPAAMEPLRLAMATALRFASVRPVSRRAESIRTLSDAGACAVLAESVADALEMAEFWRTAGDLRLRSPPNCGVPPGVPFLAETSPWVPLLDLVALGAMVWSVDSAGVILLRAHSPPKQRRDMDTRRIEPWRIELEDDVVHEVSVWFEHGRWFCNFKGTFSESWAGPRAAVNLNAAQYNLPVVAILAPGQRTHASLAAAQDSLVTTLAAAWQGGADAMRETARKHFAGRAERIENGLSETRPLAEGAADAAAIANAGRLAEVASQIAALSLPDAPKAE